MGNNNSQNQLLTKTNKYLWIKTNFIGYCHVVQDCYTGIKGQSYDLKVQNNLTLKRYQYRIQNKNYLVNIYQIVLRPMDFVCSDVKLITVITERIPYRLSDFGQFNYSQGLYILSQILKGGKLIYQEIGGWKIDENLICVNDNGQAKVWINQDISKNEIETSVIITQKDIVHELFIIIQNRMDGPQIKQYFQLKRKCNPQTFESAIHFINIMIALSGTQIKCITLPKIIDKDKEPTQLKQQQIQNKYQLKGQSQNKKNVSDKKIGLVLLPIPDRQIKQKFKLSKIRNFSKNKSKSLDFINLKGMNKTKRQQIIQRNYQNIQNNQKDIYKISQKSQNYQKIFVLNQKERNKDRNYTLENLINQINKNNYYKQTYSIDKTNKKLQDNTIRWNTKNIQTPNQYQLKYISKTIPVCNENPYLINYRRIKQQEPKRVSQKIKFTFGQPRKILKIPRQYYNNTSIKSGASTPSDFTPTNNNFSKAWLDEWIMGK